MMVMFAAIVIAGAFIFMTFSAAKNISFNKQDNQAFWIAEAGLQWSGWNAEYINPNVTFSTTNFLANGRYIATATLTAPNTYLITSTGTVTQGLYTSTRTVTQGWTATGPSQGPVADTWNGP